MNTNTLDIKPERLNILDFWRGLAVILVVAVHSPTDKFETDFLTNFIGSLYIGVILFFIISGITINLNWEKKYKDKKNGLLKFITSRIFRIVPLYWIGIIFYHYLFHLNTPLEGVFLNVFLSNWLNDIYNSSVVPGGWSISTEIYFYIFFIFFVHILNSTQKNIIAWLVSLFISKIFLSVVNYYGITISNIHNPISQLPNFILGTIFYYYVIKKDTNVSSLTVISFIFILFIDKCNASIIQNWVEFGLILFMALAFTFKNDFLNNFLGNLFKKFGKVSYSMYLIHFAILYMLNQYLVLNFSQSIVFIIRFFITVTLTYLISKLSYKYIEMPFIELGKKINTLLK